MSRIVLAASVVVVVWISPGADASAQEYGSFVGSCTEIEQRGPFLRALCQDQFGRFVPTRIDLRACPNRQAANLNGRLVCEGNGRRARRRQYENDGYQWQGHPGRREFESLPQYFQPY